VARANHEATGGGNSAKRKLANTLQMFRDLGHSTKELIAGKSADEDEDSEYLKARPRWPPLRGCASALPVHPGFSRVGRSYAVAKAHNCSVMHALQST